MLYCSGGEIWAKIPQKKNSFWGVVLAGMCPGQAGCSNSALGCAVDLVQHRHATWEMTHQNSVFLSRKEDYLNFGFAEVLGCFLFFPLPLYTHYFLREVRAENFRLSLSKLRYPPWSPFLLSYVQSGEGNKPFWGMDPAYSPRKACSSPEGSWPASLNTRLRDSSIPRSFHSCARLLCSAQSLLQSMKDPGDGALPVVFFFPASWINWWIDFLTLILNFSGLKRGSVSESYYC